MSALDLGIIGLYLVAVVCVGIVVPALRPRASATNEGHTYFLAGSRLAWPVIGLAMFAANISTVQLVSLSQSAYSYGLVYGNFEWMAGFTLVALSLFFAPVYIRSKLPTIPEFFERRYNRLCRDLMTGISLFSAVVIHIGVALYTAAYVFQGLLHVPSNSVILGLHPTTFFIILLGALTGTYTMAGGLLAVVWTEAFQSILLLVGAITMTVAGWHMIGGWQNLTHTLQQYPHPLVRLGDRASYDPDTSHFLSMMRPATDPSGLPWYSMILGYQVLAIWYWCTDQTIVQRVLAARDVRNAQLGPIFCAVLKVLPVFFFVLPGVLCVALVQKGAFGGARPEHTVDTYAFMISHLLPVGLRGLVAAAVVGAAMQTCSAALNSTATLVAYDLVKPRRPAMSDRTLVKWGRVTTAGCTILAIVLSPIFGHYNSIIEGLNKLISYAAPPITAVVIGGIFTRWATARGAAWTLAAGITIGAIFFVLDWREIYKPDYMLTTFFNCIACFTVLFILSVQKPDALSAEAEGCLWRGARASDLTKGVLVPAVCVVCVFVALYAFFW
jgi:SSS family solute:Na+ symporter